MDFNEFFSSVQPATEILRGKDAVARLGDGVTVAEHDFLLPSRDWRGREKTETDTGVYVAALDRWFRLVEFELHLYWFETAPAKEGQLAFKCHATWGTNRDDYVIAEHLNGEIRSFQLPERVVELPVPEWVETVAYDGGLASVVRVREFFSVARERVNEYRKVLDELGL